MRLRAPTALLAAAAAAALLTGCGGPGPQAGGDPDELVLGLVPSQDVDQLVLDARQLGELLTEELGVPVTTNVSNDYTALVTAMQAGQAQIGMFGPIALVQAADQAGAVPILQALRDGSATYATQWLTNEPDRFCLDEVETDDDGYTFCNGTAGAAHGPAGEEALGLVRQDETIAFVDEGSASGYYYPATQLQQVAGYDPLSLSGAFFAGGHPNAVLAVANGDASVGVSFRDARTEVAAEEPTIGADVTVFALSADIPNDGIAVAGDLSARWQQRIADAFLALAGTTEGAEALRAVYSIEGLVPADIGALDAARQVEENFGGE